MNFDSLKFNSKILLIVAAVFLPIMAICAFYLVHKVYWLEVNTSLGGLMNFVDAKQQGVIRFIGQNEKVAKQLGELAGDAKYAELRKHFAKIVATDVFDQEDHPFKDEIAAGKRNIATWRTYHAIDLVRDGKIVVSSDPAREGRAWERNVETKHGYSDVWMDGDTPVLSFAAQGEKGTVYVHADARMLTLIVNGEIGNMEGDMGAFYLAGVGKTFDYYIVNKDNVMVTESRRYPNSILKQKGSEYPWKATQMDRTLNMKCSASGTYVTNAKCTTGCREAMGFYTGPSGNEMLGASMPFYDSGWTIVVEQESDELLAPLFSLGYFIIGLSLILVIGALLILNYAIKRLVIRTLGGEPSYAAETVRSIAAGDLTVQVQTQPGDRNSMLAALQGMTEKLSKIISEVNGAASHIASASVEVSSTAQSMSQATNEQAASVEETSASVEQMGVSINQNSENAKVTDGMAAQASKQATQGGVAVKETVTAMKSIAGKIGIIDDIAYQTNLLALNAAIEAARAGDHGKGFAVVAAEVRKLAERSQVAAQEIGELASGSVSKAEDAGKLLEQMVPTINKTSDLVQEITAASEEQSSGAAQINTAMNQLNQITQQNASSTEELAATAEEMSSQAEQLQQLMSFFVVAASPAQGTR